MKFIIVIKGTTVGEYENIREDITNQIKLLEYPMPVFARLPSDEPLIEIVWTDEEMELKNLDNILNLSKCNCKCKEPSFDMWLDVGEQ